MENYRWQQKVLDDPSPYKLVRAMRTSGKTRLCFLQLEKAILKGEHVVYIGKGHTYERLLSFFITACREGRIDANIESHSGFFYFTRNGVRATDLGTIHHVNSRGLLVVQYNDIRLTFRGRNISSIVIDEAMATPDAINYAVSNNMSILIVGTYRDEYFKYIDEKYRIPFRYFEYNAVQAIEDGLLTQKGLEDARRYYYDGDPQRFQQDFGPWRTHRMNKDLVFELELIHA